MGKVGRISKHDCGTTFIVEYDLYTKEESTDAAGCKSIVYRCYPSVIGERTKAHDDFCMNRKGNMSSPSRMLKELINA